MRVLRLFLSGGHNFVGRHGQTAGTYPVWEVARAECVTGQGLRGDRFFNHRINFKGQITFFSAEVLAEVAMELGRAPIPPEAPRRNVLVSGADLNQLIGQEFSIQDVRFLGTEECRPCSWMEAAIGPGAEARLRGRGGLRAQILSDGWLRRSEV